jgi:hypothetical protein
MELVLPPFDVIARQGQGQQTQHAFLLLVSIMHEAGSAVQRLNSSSLTLF